MHIFPKNFLTNDVTNNFLKASWIIDFNINELLT